MLNKLILAFLAVIPLTQPVGALWIFSVYIFLWLLSPWLGKVISLFPLPLWFKYCAIGLLISTLLTEYFVFQDQQVGLFDDTLGRNLFLAIGIYMSVIVIWYWLLTKYRFTLKEVFFTGGLWGVVIENNFVVLLSFNIVAWLYVFLVYGSLIAIPFVLLRKEFGRFARVEKRSKYLIAFVTLFLARITGFIWIAFFRWALGW